MKAARIFLLFILLLALALPLGAAAEPVVTGDFQDSVKLLNSAQGDDGSYTQMYLDGEDVYILCGREVTYYELDDILAGKLSDWYSEVEEPDSIEDITLDGLPGKRMDLTLHRGDEPTRVSFFCVRDEDWLLYVEFTYPQAKAEELSAKLDGWVSSLRFVNGDFGDGDLEWEEVSMYRDVVSPETFPTLGDLIAWASPESYSWKAADGVVDITLNMAGGMLTVSAQGAENILPGDAQNISDLPTSAYGLSFRLSQLAWTGSDFLFDPPRGFQPGTNIQSLFDSFPDAMIQMVTNSQYGFTQSIELTVENPANASDSVALVFYGADAVVGQVVLTMK